MPSASVLYVSPDVVAFRASPTAPRGAWDSMFKGLPGSTLARGESIQLVDNRGRIVESTNYPAAPSLAQQYLRITEIMYHPAVSRPADGMDPEAVEYLRT